MGKFPIAERKIFAIYICMKCKARNPKGAAQCRRCGYKHLRPKKKKRAAKA